MPELPAHARTCWVVVIPVSGLPRAGEVTRLEELFLSGDGQIGLINLPPKRVPRGRGMLV